jgi:uncharacterized repeat protein (TIGR01451 family)
MIRKLLYSAAITLFAYGTGFSQTTPSLSYLQSYADSCYGPSLSAFTNLNVTVVNPVPGLTLDFYWGDGTSSPGNASGNLFYGTHTYALPGTYTVAAVLMNGSVAIDTLMNAYNSYCSMIPGFGYKRMDNNCTQDAGEHAIYSPFTIQVQKDGIPVDTIQSNGYFNYYLPEANLTSVFSLNVLSMPPGMTLACPSAPYTFMFDTLISSDFKFAFDCDPNATGFDLLTTGSGFFRPVSNSYIVLYPRNTACSDQSATVTLNLSPKYSFSSAFPTPTSVSGNTLTWDFSGLNNTSAPYISVTLDPVGTLTLGDTVMNTVSITPTAGDINTGNNTFVMIDSIRSSWDPNNKQVNPEGDIHPGTMLTYTVDFENSGNDTAFNIHVMDTLSQYLDASTFHVISSSHPVIYQVFQTANGPVVKFDFKNIDLPDPSNAPDNKGFVTYQISAKTGLTPGTVINTNASIYFDINPPVVTNTTWNKIPIPEGIDENVVKNSLKVYPNPSQDKLFIENLSQFNKVEITNTLGRVILHQEVKAGTAYLSIKALPAGVYFLNATNDKGTYSQKFIKQ